MPPKKNKNNKGGDKKRTLSSPDNTVILPEKRSDVRTSPPVSQSTANVLYEHNYITAMNSQGYVQPLNMTNMNSYQTSPGTFYSPPPLPQSQQQQQQQFCNSPQMTQQPQSQIQFQQFVVDRLTSLDNRLNKLDSIENQLTSLSSKLSSLDTRVTSLESSALEVNSRMNEVEAGRSFDSQISEEIKEKQSVITTLLEKERSNIKKLSSDCDKLKSVSDELTDLQTRSMRSNLLFFGFPEKNTPEDRKAENCVKMILDYCETSLNIPNAHNTIKIERAHRLSPKYENDKIRPVVVAFNHYPDKMLIKQKVNEAWKQNQSTSSGDTFNPYTKVRVSEQYPKVIQDRRKQLIPAMIRAKQDGKTAYVSVDKLYINNKMFTVDTVSNSGYSN
jgi:hypothetical protein